MKQKVAFYYAGNRKEMVVEPAIYHRKYVELVALDDREFFVYNEKGQWRYISEDPIDFTLLLAIGRCINECRSARNEKSFQQYPHYGSG